MDSLTADLKDTSKGWHLVDHSGIVMDPTRVSMTAETMAER